MPFSRLKCPSLFIFGLVGKFDLHEFKEFRDVSGLRNRCTTVLGLASGQGAKPVDGNSDWASGNMTRRVFVIRSLPAQRRFGAYKDGPCYDKINTNSNTNTKRAQSLFAVKWTNDEIKTNLLPHFVFSDASCAHCQSLSARQT